MELEGKTKRLHSGTQAHTLILETKDELTGGDAAKKAVLKGIAKHKTTQTANVFQLLQNSGIPTAFIEQSDERSLLCHECKMIPLELVMRRYAWGSFLKREPQYKPKESVFRFDPIRCEFFHKHSAIMPPLTKTPEQVDESVARGRYLKNGVWAEGVYTDPYIFIQNSKWNLHSAKAVFSEENALMEIPPTFSKEKQDFVIEKLMRPCFEVLEQAWAKIHTEHGSVALVDMKIEIGSTHDGSLVIADVIDNDSWRIWPGSDPSKQLDKQCFRDGDSLSSVSDNYALVAQLTQQFLL